jgi:uncharacterized SAM-binding protein YcdF (DUF218 family)
VDTSDDRLWPAVFILAGWLMKTAGCVIVIGAAILGYQTVLWMKDGHWTSFRDANALNLPASGVVAAFGFAILVLALRLAELAARRMLAR